MLVEHAGLEGRFEGVVRDRVPGAEDEVIEFRQRHELLDERAALLGPLAQADGAHLGERADGAAAAAAGVLDAGDEGSGHGAKADQEDTELAFGRLDFPWSWLNEILWFQHDTSLTGERHEHPVPLGRDAPGLCPVLDGALAFAEERREGALAAEAADDALGGVELFPVHACRVTEFSLGGQPRPCRHCSAICSQIPLEARCPPHATLMRQPAGCITRRLDEMSFAQLSRPPASSSGSEELPPPSSCSAWPCKQDQRTRRSTTSRREGVPTPTPEATSMVSNSSLQRSSRQVELARTSTSSPTSTPIHLTLTSGSGLAGRPLRPRCAVTTSRIQ